MTADQLIAGLLPRCRFPKPGPAELADETAADGYPIVAGVSGGADSLALLVLACAAGLDVVAVHVDHGLRPESASEAERVAEAAERFGARFRSERVMIAPGGDLEQRARNARREVLGPDAMTGHTADDQAETLLLNVMRGAGLAGLGAMEPGPRHPILDLRRSETEAVCRALDLVPVMDPSNRDPQFWRNRVRHEVLPLLADIAHRDPVPLLNRTATMARSVQDDLEGMAAEIDPTDSNELRGLPTSVAIVALRRWLVDEQGHPPSAAEIERVLAVVRHEVIACEISGYRRVARTGGRLRIERR